MKRWFPRRGALAAALAITMLAAAGGGYAIASGGTIHACAKKSNGALRLANHCRRGETGVSWGIQGPQGPQGPRGLQGAPGAQGAPGQQGQQGQPGAPGTPATSLWASIQSSGPSASILYSKGVTAVSPEGTSAGVTLVTFSQNVSQCSFVATLGSNGGGYYPGGVTIQVAKEFYSGGWGQDGKTVGVFTLVGSTLTSGYDFSIAAYC